MLNQVRHDVALHQIVTCIQREGSDPNLIVPIVIHIDEHGAFIKSMDKASKDRNPGKEYFLEMLK